MLATECNLQWSNTIPSWQFGNHAPYCYVAEGQGKETHERKQTKFFTTQGLFSTLFTLPNSGHKPYMNTTGYTEQNKETLSQFIRKPLLRSNHRKFGKKQL